MRNPSGFFAAKKEMRGFGIGLSMTSDIVKAHGGTGVRHIRKKGHIFQ